MPFFTVLNNSDLSSSKMLISGIGLSLELEHPQYFVDGRGSLQAKKGR